MTRQEILINREYISFYLSSFKDILDLRVNIVLKNSEIYCIGALSFLHSVFASSTHMLYLQ